MSERQVVGSRWRSRLLLPRDREFHQEMALEAASFRHNDKEPEEGEIQSTLDGYTKDFFLPGDYGRIAMDEAFNSIGAAWCRRLATIDANRPKRWHLPPDIPEIALAVIPEARRRGVARFVLNSLLDNLHLAGMPGACLHVLQTNVGAIDLYEEVGFTPFARSVVVGHPEEPGFLMIADLDARAVAA